MSLDTRIEAGLKAAVDHEPTGTPAPVSQVTARANRIRRRERVTWATISGLAVIAVLFVATVPGGVEEPNIGEGETLLATNPVVVQGAASPEPQFDTTVLGTPAPLSPIVDPTQAIQLAERHMASSLNAEIVRITTVGTTVGGLDSAVLHFNEDDPTNGRRLDMRCVSTSTGGSCAGIYIEDVVNEPGGIQGPESKAIPVFVIGGPGRLAWDVPEGTSVVVLTVNGESTWQRPIAQVAVFDTVLVDGDRLEVVALDQAGATLRGVNYLIRSDSDDR